MKKINKAFIFKSLLGILVIAIIIVIIWNLAPLMTNLSTKEGQIAFKEQINSMGVMGFLMLAGLQLAQILLIVLPGEPLEVLAGMCYGAVGGTIFILFTAFISTVLIYLIISRFGKKCIYHFIKKEKLDKLENSKVFKNTQNLEIIMFILFFIPGTPKDLLVYAGALLPIKPIKFILISTLGRLPSIISSTIVGSNLSVGDWKSSVIVYGITFIITGIAIFISRKKGGKDTEDLMKMLK